MLPTNEKITRALVTVVEFTVLRIMTSILNKVWLEKNERDNHLKKMKTETR